jgi:ABC-type uncharacterized transport system permease subunit
MLLTVARIAGVALGLIALVLHAVLLWRGLFDRPVLSFTIAETASLIGWPIGLIAVGASWLRPRFAGIGAVLTVVAGVVAATTVRGGGGAPLSMGLAGKSARISCCRRLPTRC